MRGGDCESSHLLCPYLVVQQKCIELNAAIRFAHCSLVNQKVSSSTQLSFCTNVKEGWARARGNQKNGVVSLA